MDETVKGQSRHRFSCRFAASFLLATSVAAWFHAAEAQQPGNVPRIGVAGPCHKIPTASVGRDKSHC
jgi:hypothetical protein